MTNLLLANYGAIVNVVALSFIALFAIYGYVKGFAKTFVSVFGTIFSLLFAVLLCTACANFLQSEYNLVGKIASKIAVPLNTIFGGEFMSSSLSQISQSSLGETGLSGLIVKVVLAFKDNSGVPLNTPIIDVICPTFAYYVVIAIAVTILFILFKIIFFLVGELIKKMYAFKPIKVADKTLGGVLGIISGVVHLEFLIMIIGLIPLGFFQQIYSYIQMSPIASFIEHINLFSRIVSAISIEDAVDFVKNVSEYLSNIK